LKKIRNGHSKLFFLCLKWPSERPKVVMVLKQIIDAANRCITFVKRHRRVKLDDDVVKLNLGSGLSVASGWVNIDASLNALFAGWPTPVLRLLYRWAGARKWYPEGQYVKILKEYIFLHHDLEYGIPFADESVNYIYTSHWLEHLFLDHADRLLREAYRVLKVGGTVRICVPDLDFAVSEYLIGPCAVKGTGEMGYV
jgi:SAM-dependent methyltransferase